MIARTARGTEVSVELMPDVGVNEGGWYGEIFRYDEDGEIIDREPFDELVIWSNHGSPIYFDEAERLARAQIAKINEY